MYEEREERGSRVPNLSQEAILLQQEARRRPGLGRLFLSWILRSCCACYRCSLQYAAGKAETRHKALHDGVPGTAKPCVCLPPRRHVCRRATNKIAFIAFLGVCSIISGPHQHFWKGRRPYGIAFDYLSHSKWGMWKVSILSCLVLLGRWKAADWTTEGMDVNEDREGHTVRLKA